MTAWHDKFLGILDQQIQSRHLLQHDFYRAWSRGELSLDCLREYAKEYYHHVKAFPTYLSALHAHTEDPAARRVLLDNLIEEEAGFPNHPDLWKQFALSLGATDQELAQHQPNEAIAHLISTFRHICHQGSTGEGVAALYAYESQIPAICVSKIEGLKTYYGMQNPKSWEYFRVHIDADEEHAVQERGLLRIYVNPDNAATVQHAVQRVLDTLWNFLTSLCHRFGIACTTA